MNKYEKLIEHIINDETDKARALFHEIVVEKSRDIYESLMDQEEMEETVGGNQVDAMMDEIQADESGLPEDDDTDMDLDMGDEPIGTDDDMGGMGDDMGGEGDLEDRVMDLESELEALKAEFEQLMGDEGGDDMGDMDDDMGDMDDDMGKNDMMTMEAEDDEEEMTEAKEEDDEEEVTEAKEEDDEEEEEMTESRRYKSEIELMREYVEKVTMPANSSEGHEVGHGGSVNVNKKSITDNMKNDMGGTTANIVKGGSEAAPDGQKPTGKAGGFLKAPQEIDVAKRNVNKPGGNKGAQNWYNTKASAKNTEGSTTDGSMSVSKDSILKRIN
jgi:hypothetical protein